MRVSAILAVSVACTTAATAADNTDALVKQLTAGSPAARQLAADDLADAGPRAKAAVPALSEALSSPDAELRWRAARALGSIGPAAQAAAPPLAQRLAKDDDPRVRAQAAHALEQIGSKSQDVVAALVAAVGDSDPSVRREAVETLRTIRPDPQIIVPLMVKLLDDSDPTVVTQALTTITENVQPNSPVLLEAFKSPKARYWACVIAGELGPKAGALLPQLIEALAAPEPEVRMQALAALAAIGPDAKGAVPQIIEALSASEPAVRYSAAFALGQMGDKSALAALEKSSHGDDAFLNLIDVWAMAKLAPDDRAVAARAGELATDALQSDDARVRAAGAKVLGELAAPPATAVAALAAALADEDKAVVGGSMESLVQLRASAVPALVEALQDENRRGPAIAVLAAIGPDAHEALVPLVQIPTGDDVELRREVALAIGAIGPGADEAVDNLARLLNDEHLEVRYAACHALGRIGPPAKATMPALIEALQSDDTFLPVAAGWALLRIEPMDAALSARLVPLLASALPNLPELARIEVIHTLGELGTRSRPAIPALKQAQDDENPAVRDAAAKALQAIEAASAGR